MRIWITRAEPGASDTAGRVRALGHEPVVAPLLEVRPLPAEIDLKGAGALAFTSANGVRAFAERQAGRDLPVFAVGDATAEAARQAGFAQVSSAGGDLEDLAALIAMTCRTLEGAVVAPAALERAGDLAGMLKGLEIEARAVPVYETVALDPPPGLAPVDAVLIHSPKAARRLARVLAQTALRPKALSAYCISAAAAEPLLPLHLKQVAAAARPDEPGLLALLPPP